jgi:hypothetical protein
MFSVDMVLIGASSSQKVEASDFLLFKRAQESAFGNSRAVRILLLHLHHQIKYRSKEGNIADVSYLVVMYMRYEPLSDDSHAHHPPPVKATSVHPLRRTLLLTAFVRLFDHLRLHIDSVYAPSPSAQNVSHC